MTGKKTINGERIYLRPVQVSDANKDYCRWMNDAEVTRYTESRFFGHTLAGIRRYIKDALASKDSIFLAIVLIENGRHIGNIKIHRINRAHAHAEMSLLIGEKSCWGQGIGSEAIRLAAGHAFNIIKLHKVYAGCYANNIGSVRAFKKAGFKEEALMKDHYMFEGQYIDGIQLGLVNRPED